MKIVNLTSHNIVYQHDDGTRTTYKPSGTVCRVTTTGEPTKCPIPGNTAIIRHYGYLENFPNEPDTVYIVSNPCLEFAPPDAKVVAPANGPNELCYRDEDGQVEAVSNWIVPQHNEIRKTSILEAANLVEILAEDLKEGNQNNVEFGGSLRGPNTKYGWLKKAARELRSWAGNPEQGVWLTKPASKEKKNVTDR